MKNLVTLLAVLVVLGGCSTPKYSYYFSKHRYQSVADAKTPDSATAVVSNDENLNAEPIRSATPEYPVYASAKKTITETKAVTSVPKSLNATKQPTTLKKESKRELLENKKVLKAEVKKFRKELKDDRTFENGKSQLTALLLAIFVGGIGIHRFYLGYTGAGIIQLLTFGLCGIWSLIDLIRIITGDLKPKNGEYTKTL